MTTAATAHDPIAELWCEARTWLADPLCDLRGPAAVAHVIAGKIRAAIKRQIARLELLLTKLLLIEAVRSNGVTHTHAPPRAKSRDDIRACVSLREPPLRTPEDPANPETWRVRFALRLPRVRHDRGPRIRSLGPALLATDIWRENARRALVDRLRVSIPANAQLKSRALARRFEAIRRVIADPSRAIAALARKLASVGKRARAFARRIATAFPRRCREPTLGNATGHALYAVQELPGDDTS